MARKLASYRWTGTAASGRRQDPGKAHTRSPSRISKLDRCQSPSHMALKYERLYSLVFVALEAGYDLHRCYGTPYGTVLEAQLIDRNHTDKMLIE